MAKAKKSGKKGVLTEEIIRHRLMYIKEFESITPEAAKLLTASGGHKIDDWDDYNASSLEWIKTLSDEAARELAYQRVPTKEEILNLSGLGSLSDSVAKILSKFPGDLTLDGLTSLSNKAAALLGKFAGDELSLNGITSLTGKIAEALGAYKGGLQLEGLTELNDQAAEGLASHKGKLVLNGLTSISDAAAEALSKHEGEIQLQTLESISDASALSLSKNRSIEVSHELSKHIAKVVKKHAKATSKIPSKDQAKIRALIKTEDPDKVDSACNLLATLGASGGDWVKLFPKSRIYSLLCIGDSKIWNTLAKAMRPHDRVYEELKIQVKKSLGTYIDEGNIRRMDRGKFPHSISELVEEANDNVINLLLCVIHPAEMIEMCLENKDEVSDGILELITNYDGELYEVCYRRPNGGYHGGASTALSLNGLTELSEEIAASLVKVKGGLYLDGLTELSDGLAKVLSKHKLSPEEKATEAEKFREGAYGVFNPTTAPTGIVSPGDSCAGLSLNGLTELGDAAAASLTKVNGGLCLNGLTKLSDKAARALSNHESEVGLSLNGLTKLSGEAAASLAKVGGGLCLNGLTKLSNEAAQGLSNYGDQGNIGLCLDGLTELSNEAAGYLAKVKGCLSLKGLTHLSHAAVQALSNHKAGANWRRHDDDGGHPAERPSWVMELDLGGLTELKDDVAEALSKHKGALGLPAKANPPLQKGHGFIQHIELGDAAASALAKKKGTINWYDPQEYIDSWKDE